MVITNGRTTAPMIKSVTDMEHSNMFVEFLLDVFRNAKITRTFANVIKKQRSELAIAITTELTNTSVVRYFLRH